MKYLHKSIALFSIAVLALPLFVIAQSSNETLSYYQNVSRVPQASFSVPTQVEFMVPDSFLSQFENPVVYEKNADRFVQAMLKIPAKTNNTPVISVSRNSGTKTTSLLDGDSKTFYKVEAYPDGIQRGDRLISTITLSWDKPITSSQAVFVIDATGITPSQVMVTADSNTVAPWQAYSDETILFNSVVTARRFQISFEHTGDVLISEVSIPHTTAQETTRISFLMQPNEIYEIYSNPVQTTGLNSYTQTSYNTSITGTYLGEIFPQRNDLFWNGDLDGDDIPASKDNCNEYANPDQEDLNNNGIGDACEDFDADNIAAALDNCPDRPNANQRDTDADGIGDECDPEESRLTEQYAWVPLVGILIAGVVLVGLFASVMLAARKIKEESGEQSENNLRT